MHGFSSPTALPASMSPLRRAVKARLLASQLALSAVRPVVPPLLHRSATHRGDDRKLSPVQLWKGSAAVIGITLDTHSHAIPAMREETAALIAALAPLLACPRWASTEEHDSLWLNTESRLPHALAPHQK
jgi:hypothetical protein